jgi:general stress protein CsbA
MNEAISKYCKFRAVTGSIVSGVVGLVLFFVGVFASKIVGDTSSYLLTDATVVSGDIITSQVKRSKHSWTTYFDVIYNVEYTVDTKSYKGTTRDRFSSFSQAKATLDAAKGAIKKIYYNPLDPSKNSESKSIESVTRWVSFGISTLLIGYAIVAYIFRDNVAFCAITTASNIARF